MADNTTYSYSTPTKKPGWHSRRHQDPTAQRTARIHYEATRGQKNRVETAKERDEARANRSTQDQLDLIEHRRLNGKGESLREKTRLLVLLEKEKNQKTETPVEQNEKQTKDKKPYQRKKRS